MGLLLSAMAKDWCISFSRVNESFSLNGISSRCSFHSENHPVEIPTPFGSDWRKAIEI
jgi:hypothetical protein